MSSVGDGDLNVFKIVSYIKVVQHIPHDLSLHVEFLAEAICFRNFCYAICK